MIKLFKRDRKPEVVVSVPELKEYLVKEFETNRRLNSRIEELELEVSTLEAIQIKYNTALVALDGYSNKLDALNERLNKVTNEKNDFRAKWEKANDELNTYIIRYNKAAITRDEIIAEITDEIECKTKDEIVSRISKHRGNLSKANAIELIQEA